jgi:RimJ/RimL family protein N-acetyltransferase
MRSFDRIFVARASQGQGLATEAVRLAIALLFDVTPVARIIGYVDTRNLPSIRLLERLDMHRTDVIDAVFRGEPCQEAVYALSRGGYFSSAKTWFPQ